MKISGNIIDIVNKKVFFGEILIENTRIVSVKDLSESSENNLEKQVSGSERLLVSEIEGLNSIKKGKKFILPGFIDSHIHIESSMLTPTEFAKIVVAFGTVSTVSDPHEIANVLGVEGVKFMIENGNKTPLKFYFGAPSCVPATGFETSGSVLNSDEIEVLVKEFRLKYLSEMMNFPGVIYNDEEVLKKLKVAKKYGIPVDGHAPGLSGEGLKKYAAAGITTDHESFTLDEAIEKIKLGIKLQIREGSAAKNFEALYKAIDLFPKDVMLCSDDAHPDDLLLGHINKLVLRAFNKNLDVFNVLRTCTVNPVMHYNLNAGLLQEGNQADFIVVDDLKTMNILQTYINGELVFDDGKVLFNTEKPVPVNKFECSEISTDNINVHDEYKNINVIEVIDGELLTRKLVLKPKISNGFVVSDVENDVLKIVVLNRYNRNSVPVVGFIKGFNLKSGAIASSVAHDSHNIIAVGTSDEEIVKVINRLIQLKGGIVLSEGADNSSDRFKRSDEYIHCLQLNIGGIMSSESGTEVADKYKLLNEKIRNCGCTLKAPFMTLSFMALLVIPELKIGDKGLFDVSKFELISLFEK